MKKFSINGTLHKYTFTHHKNNIEVNLDKISSLIVSNITVNKAHGFVSFSINGRIYKAHIQHYHKSENKYSVVSFAHLLKSINVTQALQESKNSTPIKNDKNQLIVNKKDTLLESPLAGRVNKILTLPGQTVTTGQPLLRIESMKMENEICAPYNTFIKSIFIQEGNVVQQNQILIEFEKKGDGYAGSKNSDEQEAVPHR